MTPILNNDNFFRKTSTLIGLTIAIAIIFSYFWWQYQTPLSNLKIVPNLELKPPSLKIEGAKYIGVTSSGKNFTIAAERITESLSDDERINILNPNAQIKNTNSNIFLSSQIGTYNIKNDFLLLKGKVIFYDKKNELKFKTENLNCDLNKGKYKTSEFVEVTIPSGVILSKGMEFFEIDKKLLFNGPTVLKLLK